MGQVHLISRKAKLESCARCDGLVFAGVEEGLPFRVDPIPLTVEGELIAQLQGRWTFGFNHGLRQIYHRDEYRMRKQPRPAVFAHHKCGMALVHYVDEQWAALIATAIQGMRPVSEDDALISLSMTLNARLIEEVPF